MKYQAVIFDLFGTLVDNFTFKDHQQVLARMANRLEVPEAPFIRLWFDTFKKRCIGDFASTAENIDFVCQELQAKPDADRIADASKLRLQYSRDSLVPKPGAIDTLKTIRKMGGVVGLITVCSSEVPVVWEESPFNGLFDTTVFSCTERLLKPDRRIYQVALDRLSLSPQSCLYVGDGGSGELTGAASLGMTPVLMLDPDELDAHRVDQEDWEGKRISRIPEILDYLAG